MAPRIEQLTVKNLRSIGDKPVTIRFPAEGALVLLGENNAGKSNLTRALEIFFGDQWPTTRQMEDHDFHGRDDDGIAVELGVGVSGVTCAYCNGDVTYFRWVHDKQNPAYDGNPTSYSFHCSNSYCGKTFPKREMRTSIGAAVLDADRRLDYQLSYASKWTMLSKLMHRFHERLLQDSQRKRQLSQIFESLVEEFSGVPEFATFKQVLADTAEDFGQNLPYRLDVDFSAYDPSNFFRSLRVHPTLGGEVRSFDELGTGQSQILALAFAYAHARAYGQSEGTVLVIDEPEANLHPLAQRWLASRLNSLAAPGLQVVITTHSPHFVDLARPENLVMVSKGADGATSVVQRTSQELCEILVGRGADAERTRPESVGPFYAAGATTELISGLFARRCVLVEGSTEALALPELFKARGLDVLKEGIAVVSAEGIGNVAKWHRLYTALGIETFCIFDTDSNKTGAEVDQLRSKREAIASALGLDGDPAEGAVLLGQPLFVSSEFAALEPNFEVAMRTLHGDSWSRLELEAADSVGESKPLRARYASQHLTDADWGDAARDSFDALVRAIRGDDSDEDSPPDAWDAPDPAEPWGVPPF